MIQSRANELIEKVNELRKLVEDRKPKLASDGGPTVLDRVDGHLKSLLERLLMVSIKGQIDSSATDWEALQSAGIVIHEKYCCLPQALFREVELVIAEYEPVLRKPLASDELLKSWELEKKTSDTDNPH